MLPAVSVCCFCENESVGFRVELKHYCIIEYLIIEYINRLTFGSMGVLEFRQIIVCLHAVQVAEVLAR